MSRTKLLLDVVSDMRSLADSLETMANAVAGNDGVSKEKQADKPSVTHEMLRELAVKLSRNGKREEIKQLIEKYGVKNITAVAESDLDSFYADLQQMEVSCMPPLNHGCTFCVIGISLAGMVRRRHWQQQIFRTKQQYMHRKVRQLMRWRNIKSGGI